MKDFVCVLLVISVFCLGCAGTVPNPIRVYSPGDEKKGVSVLKAEIADIDRTLVRKRSEKSKQERDNLLLFVGGLFVIVPFFFMDLKNNEKVEIDALLQRQDALSLLLVEAAGDSDGR